MFYLTTLLKEKLRRALAIALKHFSHLSLIVFLWEFRSMLHAWFAIDKKVIPAIMLAHMSHKIGLQTACSINLQICTKYILIKLLFNNDIFKFTIKIKYIQIFTIW